MVFRPCDTLVATQAACRLEFRPLVVRPPWGNLDFFACRTDHEAVFAFLFAQTDVRVFETYSELGQELREFHSGEPLTACFDVGADRAGNGSGILLHLWSPSVMKDLEIERITLRPEYSQGHTFRYRIRGWGLIQLYLGGVHRQIVTKTHYGHFSEKGAAAWET